MYRLVTAPSHAPTPCIPPLQLLGEESGTRSQNAFGAFCSIPPLPASCNLQCTLLLPVSNAMATASCCSEGGCQSLQCGAVAMLWDGVGCIIPTGHHHAAEEAAAIHGQAATATALHEEGWSAAGMAPHRRGAVRHGWGGGWNVHDVCPNAAGVREGALHCWASGPPA